ncbi:MAG: DUF2218 domain-containing protein [Rhizobiaceae bacterium]
MPSSSATCQTTNASRYLQQLCKHFGHKVPVTFDERDGRCTFSCGTATLAADDDTLRIDVTAENIEGLAQTKHVIESHLLRFAFRENLPALAWSE